MGHGLVHVGALFKVFVFVDTLLDEDFFEREEVQRLAQLVALYAQLGLQQLFGAVGVAAQHLAHGEEARFVVLYHAAVGRQAHLAVGKGIEGVDGFVRRGAGLQMHEYLGLCGGDVVDFPYLYLALVVGFQY